MFKFLEKLERRRMLRGIVVGLALGVVMMSLNPVKAFFNGIEKEEQIKTNLFQAENNYRIIAANIGVKNEELVEYLKKNYPHDYAKSYVDPESNSVVIKEGNGATFEKINEELLLANHHLELAYNSEELNFGSYYLQEKKGAIAFITNSYLKEPIGLNARIPEEYYNYIRNSK